MGKKNQSRAKQTPQPPLDLPLPTSEPGTLKAFFTSASFRYAVTGILLFFLLAFQAGGSDRIVGISAVLLFLAFSIGRQPLARLRERLSLPVLSVFVYLILNAAASLYSRFGSFSAQEFAKILAAFCVFGLVLLRAKKEEAGSLAAMGASVTAAFSLLSIDASSLNLLTRPFVSFMDSLGCSFGTMAIGYETGVRVVGVFGNANIMAGILAFGVFLSLFLVRSASSPKRRLAPCLLLGVNALGFLLCFSMGAIAMFVVAVLVYLLMADKGERVPLFILMVETAVICVVLAFLSFLGLGATGGIAAIPVLAALAAGALLWVLHTFVGEKLSILLGQHTQAATLAVGALVILGAGYVVLAYNLSGGYDFASGELLRRAVYPTPGTYTLEPQGTGAITVTVESQNEAETIMHKSTVLYSGALETATFTVPEDNLVLYLNLTAPEGGASLTSLALSGGENVPLGYPLLPGFIANRIQGLWANQNAIQRVVFFRDGLRIYANHPIIGNGLGSVEGLVTSVQDFFYESRYVHNHYIQVLAEMGIPGLLAFLALLGTAGAALWLRRREGAGHLLPALSACLAMMALHGGVEAVWSMGQYQSMALLLLGAITICYGKPLARLTVKSAAWITSAGLWAFTAVFAGLLYGNLSSEAQYRQIKANTRPQDAYTMTQLAKRDVYNWAQYKLDMAVNAAGSEVTQFAETAATYAEQLRALNIYSINFSLQQYFYPAVGQVDQIFQASREGIPQEASRASVWQEQFDFYEQVFTAQEGKDAQWLAEQSLMLYDQLVAFNHDRMEPIVLTAQNNTFLSGLLRLRASGVTGAEAVTLFESTLFDSANAPDINGDGIPDALQVQTGTLTASPGGWTASAQTVLDLGFFHYGDGIGVLKLAFETPAVLGSVLLDGVPIPFTTEAGDISAFLPVSAGEHHISIALTADQVLSSLTLITE